jgi:2,3-dimethylmalate lyase
VTMPRTRRLRDLFARNQLFVAPAVYDPMGALLVADAGYEAVYISGFTLAASMGLPDVGLTTLTEVVRRAASIAEATQLPTMCDADTGFGTYINVQRMVREFEKAGVAGLKFEDQVTPANRAGRPVLPLGEMVTKIRAAVDARTDPDFMIMARTDAGPTLGIEEAIKRCLAFEAAGADATHALDVGNVANMKAIVASLKRPTLGVISLPHPPILSVGELAEVGHRMVIMSVPMQFVAVKAMLDALEDLKSGGALGAATISTLADRELLDRLVGRAAALEAEEHYAALAQA